jgi:hypothetical protein
MVRSPRRRLGKGEHGGGPTVNAPARGARVCVPAEFGTPVPVTRNLPAGDGKAYFRHFSREFAVNDHLRVDHLPPLSCAVWLRVPHPLTRPVPVLVYSPLLYRISNGHVFPVRETRPVPVPTYTLLHL